MATKTISTEQLRKNYIKLAKVLHPDKNVGKPNADKRFQELQEQYDRAQKILDNKTQYQASASITLHESITGTERYFVTDDNQRFVLNVPAGIQNKQVILYRGISINSVRDAVLHIKFHITTPTKFSIIGENLILKEHIPFWKLYFGGSYQIEGPDGAKIPIKIPRKTKNGKMFRVKNAGLWNRVEKKREPLYIQFFGSIV